MSVTEELRHMLDERGVKWDELQSYEGGKMTRWRDSMGRYVTAYDEGMVTFFDDFYWQPTVRQAVDATLGRETCQFVWSLADNGWADHTCSACGYVENTDVHVRLGWHYCPSCGAKVID